MADSPGMGEHLSRPAVTGRL